MAENSSGSRAPAALFLVFLSAVFAALSVGPASEPRVLWAASLSLGIYLLALFVLLAPTREPWFGIVRLRVASWLILYSSFTFGFTTILTVNGWAQSRQILDLDFVRPALFAVGVGYTALLLGYRVRNVRSDHSALARRQFVTPASVFLVWSLGMVALVAYSTGSGGYGYGNNPLADESLGALTQPLLAVSNFRLVALAWAVYMALTSNSKIYRYLIVLMVSLNFTVAITVGMKEEFVMLGVAILLPYLMARKRVPIIGLALTLVLFLGVISPFVNQVRSAIVERGSSIGVADVLSSVADIYVHGEMVDGGQTVEESASRFALTENVAVILEATPERIPYRDLSELLSAPIIGLVPRAVWPDKPVILAGLQFYLDYWLGEGTSSAAVTVPGSLLMYGGTIALISGMLIFGVCLRLFDDYHMYRGGLVSVTAVLIVFSTIVKQEASATSILRAVPVFFVTFFIVRYLIKDGPPLGKCAT